MPWGRGHQNKGSKTRILGKTVELRAAARTLGKMVELRAAVGLSGVNAIDGRSKEKMRSPDVGPVKREKAVDEKIGKSNRKNMKV